MEFVDTHPPPRRRTFAEGFAEELFGQLFQRQAPSERLGLEALLRFRVELDPDSRQNSLLSKKIRWVWHEMLAL